MSLLRWWQEATKSGYQNWKVSLAAFLLFLGYKWRVARQGLALFGLGLFLTCWSRPSRWWQIWSNLCFAALDVGAFNDVIQSITRILELGKPFDDAMVCTSATEVVQGCHWTIAKSASGVGVGYPGRCFCQQLERPRRQAR